MADVQRNITLTSLTPPTCDGRVLEWTGERVPQCGETVCVSEEVDGLWSDFTGVVTGYFQAHGYLGVIVNDSFAAFGAEIDVPDMPEPVPVN